MKTVKAAQGRKVRFPDGELLQAEQTRTVQNTDFFAQRRIADGDLVEVKSAESNPAPSASRGEKEGETVKKKVKKNDD